jgi:hypothetical protein
MIEVLTSIHGIPQIMLYGAGGANIGFELLQALNKDVTFHTTVLARQSHTSTYPTSASTVESRRLLPTRSARRSGAQPRRGHLRSRGGSGQDRPCDAQGQCQTLHRWRRGKLDYVDPKDCELSPIFWRKGKFSDYLRGLESETLSWTTVMTGICVDLAVVSK